MANKYQDRETSPDRTKMTILPKSKSDLKVAVVYYLTRNGHFEHPHFMEVPLSSPQGLQLKGGISIHRNAHTSTRCVFVFMKSFFLENLKVEDPFSTVMFNEYCYVCAAWIDPNPIFQM